MLRRLTPPIAALALLCAASAARAQAPSYQPIRVDLTFYAAYAAADATSWGGGVAIEPKFNVTDHFSAGLRLEGAGFVTQDVNVSSGGTTTNVSQGARAVAAFLAKADYYLTDSTVRPFVGVGLGLYRIGAGSQSVSSGAAGATVVQTASSFRGFGFAPQAGLNLGGFRLAATYHIITGGDMVVATQAVGTSTPTEVKLPKNFFAFEIGGTFGGNRTAP
ncbi:MAG TPA: outer membrane beta-barrel protein [Anaeromyxobacter sp.]